MTNITSSSSGDLMVIYHPGFNLSALHNELIKRLEQRQAEFQEQGIGESCEDYSYYEYVANGEELDYYCQLVDPYLDQFDQIGLPTIVINHRDRRQHKSETVGDVVRLRLIEGFLAIARNFFDLSYYRTPHNYEQICENCTATVVEQLGSDSVVCQCGYRNIVYGSDTVLQCQRSEYKPELTFIKEMNFFMGKEGQDLPSQMFADLDRYFAKEGAIREEVKQRPLDEYGKRERTSLRMLIDGLRACGYNAYFKRANTIGHLYWGWQLIDLENYQGRNLTNQILERYRLVQFSYRLIPRARKSNLSNQGLLLRILYDLGVKVSWTDFKLCTTRDSSNEFESLWWKMCALSGIPYKRWF